MVSINTNLSSLLVQKNLTKSTNALNTAIERMTTGFKINHASDNAANYSISSSYDSKLSAYRVAQDNAAMGADMLTYADDVLSNMTSNATRLRDLCVQAQNGTYGKQSIDAIKSEARAIKSQISNLYSTAEYNGIQLFDIYSDRLEELQANSATPNKSIGLSTEINPDYNGFISNSVTYTDEQIEAMLANGTMTRMSSVSATDDTISGGKYLISSEDDLVKLATMTNAGKITSNSVEFVLGADIDISEYCAENTAADGTGGWTAIGTSSKKFKGIFDGNGHTISGLYINKTENYQGLFGYTASGSALMNVGVEGCDVKGKSYVGGLVGNLNSSITDCYATGSVNGTGESVGGLVGYEFGSITNCYAIVNVNVIGQNSKKIGGLVGYNSFSSITNCYATGYVNAINSSEVGGLVGECQYGTISNCYATGNVSGTSAYVGGLVGAGSCITDTSYATGDVCGKYFVGGFMGWAQGSITNSYATGDVSSTSKYFDSSFSGGFVGSFNTVTPLGGSAEFKNNASFGKVSAQHEQGAGSLIGGISNTTDGTNFPAFTFTNSITNEACVKNAIGGTYIGANGAYTAIEEVSNMETWNSNITTFNSTTSLQVGIYGSDSSQISMENKLNIGWIKQLESLDVSSSSSLEFMDSFISALNSKSTEVGASTNRVMSALESISVSIDNLTSSRLTIKDADIAKESSSYIKAQILQQASATLLATANQNPSIALQLI